MADRWSSKDIIFLEKNYVCFNLNKLSKMLGRSYSSVLHKSNRLGLQKRESTVQRKPWLSEEINYLMDNYNVISGRKIAKCLRRTYKSVVCKANELGLKINYKFVETSFNDDFFTTWSSELAYLTGIILSDGYVSSKGLGRFIRIKMCDRDVLVKIKNFTNHIGNITEYIPNNGCKTSYTINFYGKDVWNFFTNLSMDNDKSRTAVWPKDIPDRYISCAIRGVFDGDGSVYVGKNNYPFARICGTKDVVEFIANYTGLHYTLHKCKNDITYIIQYTGVNAVHFLDFVYMGSNNNNRMDRKYNKYCDIKQFDSDSYVGGDYYR